MINEQKLIERIEISKLSLEDIRGGYDPKKAGFDVNAYLTLPEKQREKIYWEEWNKFFQSPFNGGTIESCLNELRYESRFIEGNKLLLFTDGGFHSEYEGFITKLFKEVPKRIQETQKMWFWEHLRGYGFEHYLDSISSFGTYCTRTDLK